MHLCLIPTLLLFLHHFNVPLDDEPYVKVKRSFSIDVGAVTSFGYREDVDGQWVRKQDLPPPIPNECTPFPPPQRDASSSLLTEVLTELCDLRAFVGEHFDAMDTHFDGIGTRITGLEDDISFIRRCFDPPIDF